MRTDSEVWLPSSHVFAQEDEYGCVLGVRGVSSGVDGFAKVSTLLIPHASELRALQVLESVPSVVRLLGVGKTTYGSADAYLLVVEKLENVGLFGTAVHEVSRAGLEVLGVLEAAHKAGIVHQDVSPMNIGFRTSEDGHAAAVLLDFDMSRRLGGVYCPGRPMFAAIRRSMTSRASYDVESLLYTLIYVIDNGLPWEEDDEEQKRLEVCNTVKSDAARTLARAALYVQRLETDDDPYDVARRALLELISYS